MQFGKLSNSSSTAGNCHSQSVLICEVYSVSLDMCHLLVLLRLAICLYQVQSDTRVGYNIKRVWMVMNLMLFTFILIKCMHLSHTEKQL